MVSVVKGFAGAQMQDRHGGNAEVDREVDPMVGFGLPMDPARQLFRNLPVEARGPPYFYYGNVDLIPSHIWETASRFLYSIRPEFVDSKYFSAARIMWGYIHNLPIANRFQLDPLPPRTILEAFTSAQPYWPTWDTRTQFNCLQTCIDDSARLIIEQIHAMLEASPDPPPQHVIDWVLYDCKKWNFTWVGRNKVALLEPEEVEFLLGFPMYHTDGFSHLERYNSLGNSFQVDTIAYHLSVLKEMYPNGINVLSIFSGIGGVEVALDRLGIKMNAVLSVEASAMNRTILRRWWEQTGQEGALLDELNDVQHVNDAVLKWFIDTYGGFDLIIAGNYSHNNLAASMNLFHYFRILNRLTI